VGWVGASLPHILPGSVGAADNSVSRVAVGSIQGGYAFSMETSATRRSARYKSRRRDSLFNSAVASAQPSRTASAGTCEVQAYESAELLMRSVDNLSHRWAM
jgi:hypothetical protein